MGMDLRLSGLASGFDWKPVVEQLIELERIPQRRLESEKDSNDTKISELGILKSQLETLKSSAEGLQDADIYDARKVTHGEDTLDYLSATADIGTLAGEYRVSVYSLGTNTILTSESLVPDGVGKALSTSSLLKDLPLQTAISEGTFTVESQTYEITQADLGSKTLQQLLDEIDVDPENNGYPVTFEYDAAADRVIVDGGELNATDPSQLPILGHPNDTSNFLKVMRLLDGEVVTRTADQDNSRSFDNTQAWLRSGDSAVNLTDPAHPYGLPDSRNYTFFGNKLYQRVDDSATNPNFFEANKLDYKDNNPATGDIVYKDGFLYECIKDLPSVPYAPDSDYYALNEKVTFDSSGNGIPDSYWELTTDPAAYTNTGASSPASAWDDAADRNYVTGDVVHLMDGGNKYFFRAVADSPTQAVSPPTIHAGLNTAPFQKYSAGDKVESTGPGGQFHTAAAAWGTMSDHASTSRYVAADLVYDVTDNNDNQVYEAAAKWSTVSDHASASGYVAADLVYDVTDNNDDRVYKASAKWTGIANHAAGTKYTGATLVLDASNSAPSTVYQATAAWNTLSNWDAATNYVQNDIVWNAADNKVWQVTDPAGATLGVTPDSDPTKWTEVDVSLTNATYWTAEDTSLTGAGGYWTAEDTSLNGADGYWTNVNSAVTDLSDTTYWSAYANLDSSSAFDSNYWELIKPASSDGFWTEIGTLGVDVGIVAASDPDGIPGTGDEDPMALTDSNYWQQFLIPDPPASGSNAYWEEVKESYIRSSQALGAVDITATIENANLNGTFSDPNGDGTGSFFIGHGKGGVEITYDVETDTLTDLINRINASDAKVTMSYDAIGDQFIMQSDLTGNLGITVNESAAWDSANAGTGNLLEQMGLVADATIAAGDPTEIAGVGRAKTENLGENAIITINGGQRIFSQSNTFDEDAHGIAGLTLDVSKVTTEEVTFVVEKDISRAQAAVDTFIEEFNDAQKYVNSLVAVTRDGDSVTAGRFSGSLEISRLGSALRKIVFGDNYPHSASESTSDGTNKTVGDLDSRNLLSFDADNDGYRIYIEDPTSGAAGGYSGTSNYQEWSWSGASGDWVDFTPTYSAFRVNDVGLDFRSGSDEIYLKDSALLIQELTDNPNKVKALFAEEKPDTAELDLNTGQNREYGGLTYFLSDYIENFVESDSGTYLTHIASLRNQNERIETNIDDLERYLVQREESLSQSFIRMEEMQSRMSTQLQTLQNSFKK